MRNRQEEGRGARKPTRGTWGGARPGAGRKPKGDKAGVSHLKRPSLPGWFPVHIVVKTGPGVGNLRARRCLAELQAAFAAGRTRRGFRLVLWAVQRDGIQLLVEADSRRALSLGMQGLGIRIARGLNRLLARTGRVFADRYDARLVRTPADARRIQALFAPPHGAAAPLVEPKTTPLRQLAL